jgi:hypothetical protein
VKFRFGCDPSVVIAGQIYETRDNRSKLKSRNIKYSGKSFGGPLKIGSEKYKRGKKSINKSQERGVS